MKKILLPLLILIMNFNAISQNDTIGEYLIYHDSTEYYLLFESDTFWINHQNITIKFNDTVSQAGRESFDELYDLTFIRETSGSFYNYSISTPSNFIDICDSIYYDARVDKINFGFKLKFYEFLPDDDQIYYQWYLDKIDVFEAWDITTGNEDITVAVIDEGLFLDHADIGYTGYPLENIFHNPDEDEWTEWDDPDDGDGIDGIDDPLIPPIHNNKIDDWKGWNYRNYEIGPPVHTVENNNVIPEQPWGYHGTAVSGIIAAKTNNAFCIAGIAGGDYALNHGGVKILPIKISDWRLDTYWNLWVLETSSEKIAAAIDYAVEMGANIINMSFGVNGPPSIMDNIEAAIENAYSQHNVLLVASAGNEGYNGFIPFPAKHENVICVGATDQSDERAAFSEGGSSNCGDQMELSAPGKDIVTLDNDDFDTFEGTSFSAPMVAATAALMLSVNPDLSNEDIRTILINTAEKVGSQPYIDAWNCTHGFGRINVYSAVCEALSYVPPITINTNTLWDHPVFSLHDITIESGNVLTVTSTVFMGHEARIILEPGAEMIINGGTITNLKYCGNEILSWPGIEVWGNKNASQYTPGEHGKLILQNGAVIENAVTAVELWQPGNVTSTGGIIVADSAFFLNNARSIHAVDYRNFNPYNPTQELEYYATFTDCSFIISEEYLGDKTFYKHIDLDRVSGVRFYGCTFSCDHSANNVSEWNTGIASYNAGFKVMPYCHTLTVPCADYDSCRFNGFYWAIGVWAPAMLIDPPVLINHVHFDDNITGVYINQHSYSVILENFLEAGYDDPYTGNCGFASGIGIDIQQSNGFIVENNKLRKNSLATNGNYAGIRVKNCPSDHDIIYKNDFEGLSYGNYAEGTNRSVSGDDKTGVEYRCNCNSHNAVDFIVTASQPVDAMIRGWIGSRDTASGNVFSRYTPQVWHFRNEGSNTINYYYCDPCTDEEPINIYTLPGHPEYFEKIVSVANECPDHYGGSGHIELSSGERQEKEVAFAQNLSDYNAVKALYESLVDGGDSDAELSDIESAEPGDMWELRNQLLGDSPHLSQEVLRAMTDRTDVFPDEVLLEILSANPDELNRDTLISYLEQKENPLPEYMINFLRQAINGITYKTMLENEKAQYHAAKTQAAQDIIRSILFDTVFNMTDYRDWLDNMDNMVADRQIIATYLSENDTTSAIALLNLLPSLYGLEGEELDVYNDYQSLVEMQISWKTEGKWMNEPDTMEILALEAIASDESSYAGNMARNMLTYAGIHNYCDCLPLIDTAYLKNETIPVANTRIDNEILKISAEPNPAHTYVAYNYELLNDHATGLINISDANGILIYQIQVDGKKGQKVWNTSSVKPGIYYYNLTSSGLSKAGKVVIY